MSFTPEQAKQFFIAKVIEEASLSGVSLSRAERAMLQFSEEHVRMPETTLKEFERETTDELFEQKIVSLLKSALQRDKSAAPVCRQAMQALEREDHYIGVMVNEAFGSANFIDPRPVNLGMRSTKDIFLLLASGIAVVAVLLLIIWFKER